LDYKHPNTVIHHVVLFFKDIRARDQYLKHSVPEQLNTGARGAYLIKTRDSGAAP
jgi:hypothetical protein